MNDYITKRGLKGTRRIGDIVATHDKLYSELMKFISKFSKRYKSKSETV